MDVVVDGFCSFFLIWMISVIFNVSVLSSAIKKEKILYLVSFVATMVVIEQKSSKNFIYFGGWILFFKLSLVVWFRLFDPIDDDLSAVRMISVIFNVEIFYLSRQYYFVCSQVKSKCKEKKVCVCVLCNNKRARTTKNNK